LLIILLINFNISSIVTAQPINTTKHTPTFQFDYGDSSELVTYCSYFSSTIWTDILHF